VGCFTKYYDDVSGRPYWTVAHDLDSAVELVGCVWRGIKGSDPLYHDVASAGSFIESEKAEATSLAERVRKHAKSGSASGRAAEHSQLADDAYDFAIACLVRRGARHKGPPKIP
jgi:hypothetical protein